MGSESHKDHAEGNKHIYQPSTSSDSTVFLVAQPRLSGTTNSIRQFENPPLHAAPVCKVLTVSFGISLKNCNIICDRSWKLLNTMEILILYRLNRLIKKECFFGLKIFFFRINVIPVKQLFLSSRKSDMIEII